MGRMKRRIQVRVGVEITGKGRAMAYERRRLFLYNTIYLAQVSSYDDS